MTDPADNAAAEFAAAVEAAKREAMKELAYGASHEINNPLANIAARAQALLREESHPERRRTLEAIHEQSLRAHEMISDLMLFARPPALKMAAFELPAMVDAVLVEMQPQAQRRAVRLSAIHSGGIPTIVGDRLQLSVALKAVVQNSLDALGHGGVIEVKSVALPGVSADEVAGAAVEVVDNGPGISDDVAGKIFDPFFSGREAGRGLGFGLSKCWRIVTDHGGRMRATEQCPGACLRIELPLTATSAPAD